MSSSFSSSSDDSSFSLSSSSCRQFSLDEIKEATNHFDEKKVIGHGGEGKVYLAEIFLESKAERAPVAVKQLSKDSTEFEKEIRIVSKIKHPNLVSLLGYCNESGEKILIYEFMEKGSLSAYVKMDSVFCLSWKQRLNICLGAAYGLQHLHKKTIDYLKGIIHRDVKPANILLDENWVAKVSDFGTFKLSTAVQIDSTIITGNIRGTYGYFAPEYVMANHITRKIDVYAFGVVMFEVLCQKKPWDRGDVSFYLDETEDIGAWALKNVYSEIKANMSYDSVKAFTDVIGRSLQSEPSRRPTMDDMVLALESALQFQDHEDELTLKARRLTISLLEQKAHDNSLDKASSSRDVPPAHYTLEIDSFSQLLQVLSDTATEKYESDIFEASGYKWKLCLYPNGHTERNSGNISLYLEIAETISLPIGWEVKVHFKMFVFDQLHGTYSIFQDNKEYLHTVNESNRRFGFAKLLPLNVFKDPSNGFLIHDKCVFGVEVFDWNYSGRGECFSSKQYIEAIYTWRINNFSSFRKTNCHSHYFTFGDRTWAIKVYPKGDWRSKGVWLSLYLELNDIQTKGGAYASYKLRIRDQLHGKHKENTAVTGKGFIAMGITFENTARPEKGQAVALRSSSDFSVFYSCSFKGYQDTLYIHSLHQFYRDCHIYGTVDFIFGDAVAILQNCNIYVRKPMNNQQNCITAHGRNDAHENTGFVIHHSRVIAAPDLEPYQYSFRTYLGRPWKRYSRTVFMKSFLDALIDPAGWIQWDGNDGLNTLYYAEYDNKGRGANTRGRVDWAGYHVIRSAYEASKFTVRNFLGGDLWIRATGVPFNSGL